MKCLKFEVFRTSYVCERLSVSYVVPPVSFSINISKDQSLYFLTHMSICRKHLSRFLLIKTVYEYNYMEKADLGKYLLLLRKPGFQDDVTYLVLSD